jgi:uncharacterized protein (TIGR02246 family)
MRVFTTFLAAGTLACQTTAQPLLDTDKSAMRATTDSLTARVVQRRDSVVAALYTENATLMPPNHGIVRGRAEIRTFVKNFPPLSHFTAPPIEIDGRGDLAYVRGTYQLVFVPSGGRANAEDHGKFLEILRRQPDGRWLIAVDIYNSDVPLPTR